MFLVNLFERFDESAYDVVSVNPDKVVVEEQSQELWVSRGKGFGKGLNIESNNSQPATTTVLAGVEGGDTAERRHSVLPRFRALQGR